MGAFFFGGMMARTGPNARIPGIGVYGGSPTFSADLTGLADEVAQILGQSVATTGALPASDNWIGRTVWVISDRAFYLRESAGWSPIASVKRIGHMGRTSGFQSLGGSTAVVGMTAAQLLQGGVTFDSGTSSLVAPLAGTYTISGQFFATGGGGGIACSGAFRKNGALFSAPAAKFWKGSDDDAIGFTAGKVLLAAGDKISLWQQGASAFGTDGYNGSFLELESAY